MVANVLLNAPTKKDIQGESFWFNPACSRAAKMMPFNLSKTPYVIAGLTVRTSPGLMPSQSPVTPSSSMISLATARKESSSGSSVEESDSDSRPSDDMSRRDLPTC